MSGVTEVLESLNLCFFWVLKEPLGVGNAAGFCWGEPCTHQSAPSSQA